MIIDSQFELFIFILAVLRISMEFFPNQFIRGKFSFLELVKHNLQSTAVEQYLRVHRFGLLMSWAVVIFTLPSLFSL